MLNYYVSVFQYVKYILKMLKFNLKTKM